MTEIHLKHSDLRFTALNECTSENAPVVLCLHGFPDNNHSYDQQIPALVDAGYRVIVPLIRGYEPSSQPADGDYHLNRMVEDVGAWIDQLDVEKVHLIGHDWGACIGYLSANTFPEKLHSLTTLSIPPLQGMQRAIRKYPKQIRLSWYTLFFQLRGVSDWWVERSNWKFIERLWRDWSPTWDIPQITLDSVKRTFEQSGVKKAALTYYRHTFDQLSAAAREVRRMMAEKTEAPTMAIGGWDDGCMSARLYDYAEMPELYPKGLRIERIHGAGHFLHQEKPEEVNSLILEWLSQNS
jgi:pimeloyl-ACP methyl ester carboxylesterase